MAASTMSNHSYKLLESQSLIEKGLVHMGKFGRMQRAGKCPGRP